MKNKRSSIAKPLDMDDLRKILPAIGVAFLPILALVLLAIHAARHPDGFLNPTFLACLTLVACLPIFMMSGAGRHQLV